MRYVKFTKDQANKVRSTVKGYTSGKRDKVTGQRENITFCSSLEFVKAFGHEIEREFIEI